MTENPMEPNSALSGGNQPQPVAAASFEHGAEVRGNRPAMTEKLTEKQACIISAYTGVLCCHFAPLHRFIEETLGRPVWTHELADEAVQNEIKEKTRDQFLALIPSMEASHD